MSDAHDGKGRDVTRAVLAVALLGGLLLVVGAGLRLEGGDGRGLASIGAAIFLLTPLARNAAVLLRERRRAPRLLALFGTTLLLVVYTWTAWALWPAGGPQ